MENPFKKIGEPPKAVPKELKKKVMEDVAAFKFLMDLGSLFSFNYTATVASFFNKRKNKTNNKQPKNNNNGNNL